MSAADVSTYEAAFTALWDLGWHECKITVFFRPDLYAASHRVRLEVFRPSYQRDFYAFSLAEAFANAVAILGSESGDSGDTD